MQYQSIAAIPVLPMQYQSIAAIPILPMQYQTTINGNQFLLHDSGINDQCRRDYWVLPTIGTLMAHLKVYRLFMRIYIPFMLK